MKFKKYKQVCRLNFIGEDDVNRLNTASIVQDNNEARKTLKFHINCHDVKLNQSCRVVLEHCSIPRIFETVDRASKTLGSVEL